MTPDDPDPQDAPEFDRALSMSTIRFPTRSTVIRDITQNVVPWMTGRFPSTNCTRYSLEAEQTLRETDEQLPEPLTLSSSLTELRALQTRMLGSIVCSARF